MDVRGTLVIRANDQHTMPRRRRCDGAAVKARLNNNHLPVDDSSMDDDLEDCGSPPGCAGSPGGQPLQRNAANARERARMRVLSRAFCRLKTTLPWVPADTKLSKLDTLRLATSYIAHLRDVLLLPEAPPGPPGAAAPHPHAVGASNNPLNLTWPFAFPQPGAPGVPGLSGPEPWISRGSSSSSARATSSSARHGGPATATAPCSGASSNASSSGADDDLPVKDEDGVKNDDMVCRRGRGLSGGHLVELQQSCQQDYAQQYQPFLQRFVDVMGSGAM
ncbi:uncharacterized protein LOC117650664 [Thrips palmi]|uniref:Uncharacterized protein LOC117650664 n=1 Tax=Thrips palmi TaxID=161013 RepID=A0A6P8ZXH6_THRPL|nr:uncharacterized protein LOC117650664 [Thrips palmi]